jgi:hypothetical protein
MNKNEITHLTRSLVRDLPGERQLRGKGNSVVKAIANKSLFGMIQNYDRYIKESI